MQTSAGNTCLYCNNRTKASDGGKDICPANMPLIITAAISFHFKLKPLIRRASFLSSGRLSLHESTREFSHARFNHGIQRARSLAYYATEGQNRTPYNYDVTDELADDAKLTNGKIGERRIGGRKRAGSGRKTMRLCIRTAVLKTKLYFQINGNTHRARLDYNWADRLSTANWLCITMDG